MQGLGVRVVRGLRTHAARGGGIRETGRGTALGRLPRHRRGRNDGPVLRPSRSAGDRRQPSAAARDALGRGPGPGARRAVRRAALHRTLARDRRFRARMRILLAAHQTQGGIGTVAQGLAAELPRALDGDDRIDVVRGWSDRRLRESKVGRLTFEQGRLPLTARGYDLVHLCDFRPVVLSGSPFLLTIHDVFFLQNPEWFPARVARYKTFMLDLALRKRPAQIVCVSEWTKEQLLEARPSVDRDVVVAAPAGMGASGVRPGQDVNGPSV